MADPLQCHPYAAIGSAYKVPRRYEDSKVDHCVTFHILKLEAFGKLVCLKHTVALAPALEPV